MVLAIIQARMTSARLPGKVLADLDGMPLLEYLLRRIEGSRTLTNVVVATTVNESDDPIVDLCDRLRVDSYRGAEHDVLGRFVGAVSPFRDDTIVRLTADCPLTDPELVDQIVSFFMGSGFDYVSNVIRRTFPDGLDVEVFSRAALARANDEAASDYDREHVTSIIHQGGESRDISRIGHFEFAADFGHLRWTVDTERDLERVRGLVARLPRGYSWLEALAEATAKPEWLGPQV